MISRSPLSKEKCEKTTAAFKKKIRHLKSKEKNVAADADVKDSAATKRCGSPVCVLTGRPRTTCPPSPFQGVHFIYVTRGAGSVLRQCDPPVPPPRGAHRERRRRRRTPRSCDRRHSRRRRSGQRTPNRPLPVRRPRRRQLPPLPGRAGRGRALLEVRVGRVLQRRVQVNSAKNFSKVLGVQ